MGSNVSKDLVESLHVVIIGGGYGGMHLACLLQEWGVPFTLIDPKEYFHHCIGALRAVVETSFLPKTTINYKDTFGSHFVQGRAENINLREKRVMVDTGDIIQYTDLVVAVGSVGPFPGKSEYTTVKELQDASQALTTEIEKATNVIVVGGGAVGIEMAGEVAGKHSGKFVTVIGAGKHLVTMNYGHKFQRKILSALRDRNINAITDERVSNLEGLACNRYIHQNVLTNKGQGYKADLVIECTGLRPNNSFTRKVFDESKFDVNGRLKVNSALQVIGLDNVYAIGDCCNTSEEKMAAHAESHAICVATNIWRTLQGKNKLPYRQEFTGMLLSVGARHGAGVVNGWHFPSFMVGLVKGRTLFSSKYWGTMRQKVPSK